MEQNLVEENVTVRKRKAHAVAAKAAIPEFEDSSEEDGDICSMKSK